MKIDRFKSVSCQDSKQRWVLVKRAHCNMELGADEHSARTFAANITPEYLVRKQTFTNTTALNRSHKRVESDLDDMRADVDEALELHGEHTSSSEEHLEQTPHDSTILTTTPPSDEEGTS